MRLARYFFGIVGSLGVTTLLFAIMNALITHDMNEVSPEPEELIEVNFVRLQEKEDKQEQALELPQLAIHEQAPPAPNLLLDKSILSEGSSTVSLKFDLPTEISTQPEINLGDGPNLASGPSDSDAVPMVRVQPMYPSAAAQARIEGWVAMEFSIDANGHVKNAKVIESRPSSIFNQAALAALEKWKYKAKIIDGNRVERTGIRVRFSFELENLDASN